MLTTIALLESCSAKTSQQRKREIMEPALREWLALTELCQEEHPVRGLEPTHTMYGPGLGQDNPFIGVIRLLPTGLDAGYVQPLLGSMYQPSDLEYHDGMRIEVRLNRPRDIYAAHVEIRLRLITSLLSGPEAGVFAGLYHEWRGMIHLLMEKSLVKAMITEGCLDEPKGKVYPRDTFDAAMPVFRDRTCIVRSRDLEYHSMELGFDWHSDTDAKKAIESTALLLFLFATTNQAARMADCRRSHFFHTNLKRSRL